MIGELLVIDTDCGVDDAEALIFAFSQQDVAERKWNILGITCVHGNTNTSNAAENVLRVLKLCGKIGTVPVFKGASENLVGVPLGRPENIHGSDGFGGIAHTLPVDRSFIQSEHAVNWLTRTVCDAFPGEITLITLGPLTNLALACRLEPKFKTSLKRLCIMGGNHLAHGNTKYSSEFNFASDPEAASVVLGEFQCPVDLVSWETCTSSCLPWDWFNKWLSSNSIKADFIRRITAQVLENRRETGAARGRVATYYSCDLFAMACFLCSELVVKEKESVFMLVETKGAYTRGQCVVDWLGKITDTKPNVNLITEIDTEKLAVLLEEMLL